MKPPPALQASGITVRIGRRSLVENVSFSLPVGSMTVLLGPNGAGKTTLLRVLAGVIAPTTGDVYFGECRLRQMGRSAGRRACPHFVVSTWSPSARQCANFSTLWPIVKLFGIKDLTGLCAKVPREAIWH